MGACQENNSVVKGAEECNSVCLPFRTAMSLLLPVLLNTEIATQSLEDLGMNSMMEKEEE